MQLSGISDQIQPVAAITVLRIPIYIVGLLVYGLGYGLCLIDKHEYDLLKPFATSVYVATTTRLLT